MIRTNTSEKNVARFFPPLRLDHATLMTRERKTGREKKIQGERSSLSLSLCFSSHRHRRRRCGRFSREVNHHV